MSDRARVDQPLGESALSGASSPSHAAELLAIATDPVRRAALLTVQEEGPLPVPDVATHVIARDRDCPLEDVSESERRRTTTALHHSHLPRLADGGLIELDRDDGRAEVQLAVDINGPTLETIEELTAHDQERTLVALFADPNRRQVVREIAAAEGSIPLADLAEGLAAHTWDGCGNPDGDAVNRSRISLHHVHLPQLEAVGIVEYDDETRRVALQDLPTPFGDLLNH